MKRALVVSCVLFSLPTMAAAPSENDRVVDALYLCRSPEDITQVIKIGKDIVQGFIYAEWFQHELIGPGAWGKTQVALNTSEGTSNYSGNGPNLSPIDYDTSQFDVQISNTAVAPVEIMRHSYNLPARATVKTFIDGAKDQGFESLEFYCAAIQGHEFDDLIYVYDDADRDSK